MAGLYGITGNTAGVAVGNTTGLYQQPTGNIAVLNSAQSLYNLLENSSTIAWELVNSNQNVEGYVIPGCDLTVDNLTLNSNLIVSGANLYISGNPNPVIFGQVNVGANTVPLTTNIPIAQNPAITFTLPGAGEWLVSYTADAYVGFFADPGVEFYAIAYLQDSANVTVPGSTQTIAGFNLGSSISGNFFEATATGQVIITTTGPETYTLNTDGVVYSSQSSLRAQGTKVIYQQLNPTFFISNIPYAPSITANTITTGNILTNNYLFANGVSIFSSIGPGSYGNTQVAAYLAVGNDPTILAIDANVSAANAAIATVQTNLNTFETYANAHFSTSTYSNANVTAYLAAGTDPTILSINANITAANVAIAGLQSNAAVQETEISGLRANITAANAAIVTVQNNLNTFETYANATYATQSNVGTIYTHLNTLDANVGAYEIANNANVGTIYTHLNTLDANVGAFETYANATFSTGGASFSGNLAGNVLYDGINYRLFANAYPLSTPSAYTILGTNGNNFIGGQTVPTYTAGVLQAPQFGYTTGGAQTIGLLATANVALATGGATGFHTTLGHSLYQQVSINSATDADP